MRWSVLMVVLLAGAFSFAQQRQLRADFRGERERVAQDCWNGIKGIFGCAEELFTDHPLHIAVGSIAPQNGFGAGAAFVTHYTPNKTGGRAGVWMVLDPSTRRGAAAAP